MTTTNIAAELARWNQSDFTRDDCLSYLVPSDLRQMLALLNTMHGLLVQAEGALRNSMVVFDQRGTAVSEQTYSDVLETLTALRDAGIGGDRA